MFDELKKEILKTEKPTVHTDNSRWYRTGSSSVWKPSITTILGAVINKGIGFETWLGNQPSYKIACQERDEAAARGTAVHNACEDYLNGKEIDGTNSSYGDEFNKRMMSFESWVKNINPEIIALEHNMYHPDVAFSGTFDILANIPGKGLSVIDIKTGQPNESHILQLTAYKLLWDTLYPDYKIKRLYGLYLKGTWISKVEPLFKEYKYMPEMLEAAITLYKLIGKGRTSGYPTNNVTKTVFKLDDIKKEEELVL